MRLSQINYNSKRFPLGPVFFFYYTGIVIKTKGQQPLVAKLEPLALCDFRGGLAEWSNASGCKPVDGASPTAQGFESLTRRQNNYTPAEALTSPGPEPHSRSRTSPTTLVSGFWLRFSRRIAVTCHNCRIDCKKAGKRPDGQQRYRCAQCSKTFSEPKDFGLFGHKQVNEAASLLALRMICEGNSIRSTERITGLHRDSIMKLLTIAGQKCEALLATKIRNVPVADVQADEIWGFVGKKEGHKNPFGGDDMYLGGHPKPAIEGHFKTGQR